ncbi:MAG TPA: carboxy-S-adenosyl-L-methionine synthase CmoA [Gammaproteobacteria bacterium]|nr:carboxy-S-adenosyl-L-methionine synthase CmoA [Gammaproteobacteria bacterium]
MNKARDELFRDPGRREREFDFGSETARVFDDMLQRSVPFYGELQNMIAQLAGDFATPGSRVYDLGCSTGNGMLTMASCLPETVTLVGVDASSPMLEQARTKLEGQPLPCPWQLIHADLNQGLPLDDASVVVMNLTLQFIRPLYRERLVRGIADSLQQGGCFILVEKVLGQDSLINRLFIRHYYDFKRRQGYDDSEIMRKREALENILIPYHQKENEALLMNNGFSSCDCFFRWYNFCGMLAIK